MESIQGQFKISTATRQPHKSHFAEMTFFMNNIVESILHNVSRPQMSIFIKKLCSYHICDASRQKSTNVGNFKIELGARYNSRSVHLSFKTKIMFLSISFAKLWYNSLLWNRGVRNINFTEIGCKVRSVKNTEN